MPIYLWYGCSSTGPAVLGVGQVHIHDPGIMAQSHSSASQSGLAPGCKHAFPCAGYLCSQALSQTLVPMLASSSTTIWSSLLPHRINVYYLILLDFQVGFSLPSGVTLRISQLKAILTDLADWTRHYLLTVLEAASPESKCLQSESWSLLICRSHCLSFRLSISLTRQSLVAAGLLYSKLAFPMYFSVLSNFASFFNIKDCAWPL